MVADFNCYGFLLLIVIRFLTVPDNSSILKSHLKYFFWKQNLFEKQMLRHILYYYPFSILQLWKINFFPSISYTQNDRSQNAITKKKLFSKPMWGRQSLSFPTEIKNSRFLYIRIPIKKKFFFFEITVLKKYDFKLFKKINVFQKFKILGVTLGSKTGALKWTVILRYVKLGLDSHKKEREITHKEILHLIWKSFQKTIHFGKSQFEKKDISVNLYSENRLCPGK